MQTAIVDKFGRRHLIVSLQQEKQIVVLTHIGVSRAFKPSKIPPRIEYISMTEEAYHNRVRATVALNKDTIVKKYCIPVLK